MSASMTIQLNQRGVLTLPKQLREEYDLQPGAEFTLVDMDGVFVLSRRRSQVDALAERIASALVERGETLESMLMALREERERYDPEA